jgi:hypothetical protein
LSVADYRESGHLPQLREGGLPPDPAGLPRQRRGTTPQMVGRYPDYDVLANTSHWDETTRSLVLSRLGDVPPIRFFDAAEERVLRPFCDCVTAQDAEPRIPALEHVDEKLFSGKRDGFRHAGMPDDGEVWRIVARALDGLGFAQLTLDEQHGVCGRFADGELDLGGIDCSTAWSVVMRYTLEAFYSHPWAWNEIGFGGPAYPRGYARLGIGMREPWEGSEEWSQDAVRDVEARGLE